MWYYFVQSNESFVSPFIAVFIGSSVSTSERKITDRPRGTMRSTRAEAIQDAIDFLSRELKVEKEP